MHFWIDKRSQGCGYNGRHRIPPSLSGPRRSQRLLCGGVHPKLMVTPVHRFQSIESVATGGLRHPRTTSYHARFPFVNSASNYNASTRNCRSTNDSVRHSVDTLAHRQNQTVTTRNTPTTKCKCSIFALFAIITFFIAGAKYYFHGANMGIEALAFCSLLVIILIAGGLVSLYEALSKVPPTVVVNNDATSNQISTEPVEQVEESSNQVPNANAQTALQTEMPPPPYHIAIMLPAQNDQETIEIIRDSPPPSYDKAVT